MENEAHCGGDQIVTDAMLDGVIRYLNTDLDLRSAEDLTPLATLFKSSWDVAKPSDPGKTMEAGLLFSR
ncbi:MAG: hypothetical protein R2911_40580 [Caldilineaceae bacterium]